MMRLTRIYDIVGIAYPLIALAISAFRMREVNSSCIVVRNDSTASLAVYQNLTTVTCALHHFQTRFFICSQTTAISLHSLSFSMCLLSRAILVSKRNSFCQL